MPLSQSEKELSNKDPLHAHLALLVLPRVGVEVRQPKFEANCLSNRQTVYLYREQKSNAHFVGKFFGKRSKVEIICCYVPMDFGKWCEIPLRL